ncbi:MAG TPA: DNA repair protein RecN [Candidatus Cloacimonadota bacterium]|nr:DNA repair protein RecN [Candidatus Cloacimonadota bacterium]
MLSAIRIQNYLFVPEARLEFGPGMTVLTGETGAGKSILVGAISLIFGDGAYVPEPYDSSLPIYLEADFRIGKNSSLIAKLEELGHADSDELTLARQISVNGRSVFYINGRKVAAALMKELRPLMIDFHHQRDQQRLLQASFQLEVLDAFAGTTSTRLQHGSLLLQLRSRIKQLEELRLERERNAQLDELYRFQLEELEAAAVKTSEDIDLQHQYERLSHTREIRETGDWVRHNLYEKEDSARDLIRSAINSLERFTQLDERVAQLVQSLHDSLQILGDAAPEAEALCSASEDDPERLETIRLRLDQINSLLYKHRVKDIAQLLELFEQRRLQIGSFDALDGQIASLDAGIRTSFTELVLTGEQLGRKRAEAASRLSSELQNAIRALAIPEARFEISIDKKASSEMLMPDYLAAISSSGADLCEFRFSANPGIGLRPLADVASGGELSRVLLAIKKVLAGRLEPRLMILDEIDAGIGGKTAEAVAAVIRELAQAHVVLCVTHLASIAAVADWHLALDKVATGTRTLVSMRLLDDEARPRELARMLSGSVTEASLRHASELMNK